jgi:hypothetical protein
MNRQRIMCVILFSVLPFFSCTAPQYFWPQKDIESHEIHRPILEKRILIASRQSEFKNAVVEKIEATFLSQAVYIKVIGIEDLKFEDATQYSATVLINTAMGWKIDRKVDHFLDRHQGLNSIVVLTTSDGGNISPDTEKHQVDAISSASVIDQTELVTNKIVSKINELIKKRR